MSAIASSLNEGITTSAILGSVPNNVGTLFVTIIIFSIGIGVIGRILRAVQKNRVNI